MSCSRLPEASVVTAHSFPHRVEFGETDAAGIVFYPNYMRWFDRATHELFRSLGAPLALLMRERELAPIVLEAHCRLLMPLVYDEEVAISARVGELRTRALRIEHAVRRGDDLVATGHEVRIWTRLREPGIAPIDMPVDIRAMLSGGQDA